MQMEVHNFDSLVPLAQQIRLQVANGDPSVWCVSPPRSIDETTCCKSIAMEVQTFDLLVPLPQLIGL